ncbi:MAG: hypothetical protein ABTS22_09035, partial [Accumulibacter sp.]|uniref:hypothetical protein n=1 Tax=Accumulibacter sp. TaxID=2053492 RepID=UPI003315525E
GFVAGSGLRGLTLGFVAGSGLRGLTLGFVAGGGLRGLTLGFVRDTLIKSLSPLLFHGRTASGKETQQDGDDYANCDQQQTLIHRH